jgi:excisionase family DNA binding protein
MPTRIIATIADLDGQLFADVPEVADVLRIDQRTVRRSIEAGDIPAIRTGQRYRIPTAWLRKAAGAETSGAGS